MTLNEYQKQAMKTCLSTCENIDYMMLNLVGEVGEFASKIAKAIRQNKIYSYDNNYDFDDEHWHNEEEEQVFNENALRKIDKSRQDEWKEELSKEAGDILWQLSGLCSVMGWNLEDIAQQNLDKLASRQKRNVIDGNGDNR